MAGIVIAVLFIVGASAGIGYYILVVKAAEASASAAGTKTVVVDNTMTVRSVVSEANANAPSDTPGNPTSDDSTKAIEHHRLIVLLYTYIYLNLYLRIGSFL